MHINFVELLSPKLTVAGAWGHLRRSIFFLTSDVVNLRYADKLRFDKMC